MAAGTFAAKSENKYNCRCLAALCPVYFIVFDHATASPDEGRIHGHRETEWMHNSAVTTDDSLNQLS